MTVPIRAAEARTSCDVAVIIPARNASATLDAAIGSVASQTTPPAGVVVVDDGSDDATADVARRWHDVLRLQVISLPENRGPGHARHTGVLHSAARFLAFLDADDVWLPDHLELCIAALAQSGGAVAARGIRWVPGSGIDPAAINTVPGPPKENQLDWIIRRHTFGTPVVLARTVYDEVGGFDPTMEGVEDWDFWIRAVHQGVHLSKMSIATFLYRQHAGSLSTHLERVSGAAMRMLDRVGVELLTSDERERHADALRVARARVALNLAYLRLDAGDYRAARSLGMIALRGERDIALRGALVAVAPGWRRRDRARRREMDRTR